MNALVSLASIVESKAANHDEDAAEEYDEDDFEDDEDAADAAVEQQALLPRLMEDWRDYMTDYHAIRADGEHDSEHEDEHEGDFALSMEALYVLLMEGNTDRVVDAIASVLGADPQIKAFASLWKVLDKTCESEAKLVSREPQYVLDCAWRACGKAEVWQRVALEHSAAGRAANDRLDAAMRLFNYASRSASQAGNSRYTPSRRSSNRCVC